MVRLFFGRDIYILRIYFYMPTATSGVRSGAVLPARGPVDPSAGLLVRVAVHGTLAEGQEARRLREGCLGHRLPRDAGGQLRDALHHQGGREVETFFFFFFGDVGSGGELPVFS